MSPVDPKTLERALAKIKMEYGEESVRLGSSYTSTPRISTGALELDLVTDGGLPMGRVIHMYGGQFSGKTMIALNAIGNAQKMGQVAVFYDVEKQFNAEWAEKHGVDTDKLIVVEKTTIEDIGTAMEALLGSAHMHVIDSIPAAVSLDELAAGNDEWRPGISARAWGKTLRRVQERFDPRENTLIMINHVGMVFGKYAGGEEPKGAKFIEYLSSLSLEFKRSSWLMRAKDGSLKKDGDSEESLSGDKTPGGIEFQVRVKKSRVSVPFQSARLRLDFSSGQTDDTWSLVKAAQLYEVTPKSSAGWFLLDGKKVRESEIRERIENDAAFKDKVIEAIRDSTK